MRIIHTDTYTPKALDILKAVHHYMEAWWGSSQMRTNACQAKVEQQPNGEVTWSVDDSDWYYRRTTYAQRRDDAKVREWLAMVLKTACYRHFKSYGLPESKNWKRTNTKVTIDKLNNMTVADAYIMYERLLNRKTFTKRWSKKQREVLIGEERDPVATELELARREETKKIEDKYSLDKRNLENDRWHKGEEAARAAREKVYAEYKILEEKLNAEHAAALKTLNESLNFMAEIG